VEDRPLGLEVEALDVDEPPVAGLHQHRDSVVTRVVTQPNLDVEAVALVEQEIEATARQQEVVDRVVGDAVG
jgi:hypothetical protein